MTEENNGAGQHDYLFEPDDEVVFAGDGEGAGADDGGEGDLTEPENVDELHREVGEEYQGKTFNYQNIVPYYFLSPKVFNKKLFIL